MRLIMYLRGRARVSAHDLNVVDVLALVRQRPELTDDFVDLSDFHTVELQEGLIERTHVAVDVIDGDLRGLKFDHAVSAVVVDVLVVLLLQLAVQSFDLVADHRKLAIGPRVIGAKLLLAFSIRVIGVTRVVGSFDAVVPVVVW